MNGITEKLLGIVSDWAGSFNGAFNIRENGQCAGRQSTAHIKIESKTDVPGLDIRILPGTKGESVSIPACVTHGDVDDLVYNDFFVGDGADVTIVAGCGVHTDDGETARSTERTLAWTSFPVLLPREILIRLTARVSLATRAAQATRNVTPSLQTTVL